MGNFLAAVPDVLIVLAVLVAQYFLVKQPQKWMAFILPAIYFLISIKDVIQVVQGSTFIMGGAFGTSVLVFLMSNIMTAMLLMVWWKRDFDKATIAIAAFAVYILGSIAIALFTVVASFFWTVNV